MGAALGRQERALPQAARINFRYYNVYAQSAFINFSFYQLN